MAGNAGKGRPKLGKAAKDSQIMVRTTDATAAELQRIAAEMDRSVSWVLNDLAVRFIASRRAAHPAKKTDESASQAF
jgi:predicted transcriptional regulator